MKNAKECMTELSGGELVVKAAMEAELSGKDENGGFALTIARLALLTCQGGRGEHGATTGKVEAAMARWSGREATTERCDCASVREAPRRERERAVERERVRGSE